MLKQSGPANGVKCTVPGMSSVRASVLTMFVTLISLSACGTVWQHASKSGAVATADERTCARRAQEAVLIRAGIPRTEYGARPAQSSGSLERGESPMELHERSQTTTAYNKQFESCMRSKGYSKD
jgi:hypothetical protein